ncbi:E3 ubiquitin-protein ligase RNF166 isoform 1-T1 [Sarcoramphus papa]
MLGAGFCLAPFKSAPGCRSRSSGVVCASAARPGSSFGAWAVPGLPAPSPKLPVLSSSSQRGCRSLGFGAALQPGACRSPREQVLRGVPAALPASAVPALPALPHALRPQEGGEGFQRGETAFVLQGSLQRLQQEGDPRENALSRLVLREGAGADGQLPQVRSSCPHVPAYPQQYSQSFDVRVPVLRGPEPGPAGAGEALYGEPPQRPQQSGVPSLLSHALGGPQLQKRQLPPAPPAQAQVLLRHLRGL